MAREPTEMELRVAKAICGGYWHKQRKAEKAEFIEQARAAIHAMREPTDEMARVIASAVLNHGGHEEGYWGDLLEPWHAGIDAASPPIEEN